MIISKNKTILLKCCFFAMSFFLLALLKPPVSAQQYLFDTQLITTDDGLANLMATATHIDREGFVWIGTQYGLNRYDGYSFRHYTKEKNGLQSNKNIRGIAEDGDGNIWLFYLKGLNAFPNDEEVYAIDIFNTKTAEATSFEDFFIEGTPFNVTEVNVPRIIDSKKRLWLTTTKGQLFLYDKGQFKKIFEQEKSVIKYLTVDQQDQIWLGMDKEVIGINTSGKILEAFALPDRVFGIWADREGTPLAGQ